MVNDKNIRGADIFLYIFRSVFGVTIDVIVYICIIIILSFISICDKKEDTIVKQNDDFYKVMARECNA